MWSRSASSLLTKILALPIAAGGAMVAILAANLIVHPTYRAPLANPTGGALAMLGAFGCFVLAYRLITGSRHPADGGLLSPAVLRVFGVIFMLSPALFAYYVPHPEVLIAPSAMCIGMAAGMFRAAKRQNEMRRRADAAR